jgi:hypothetical protein
LECGHRGMAFGDLAHLEGKAYCEQCAKERNAPVTGN